MELINNLKDSERKLTATLSAVETFEAEEAANPDNKKEVRTCDDNDLLFFNNI